MDEMPKAMPGLGQNIESLLGSKKYVVIDSFRDEYGSRKTGDVARIYKGSTGCSHPDCMKVPLVFDGETQFVLTPKSYIIPY